MSVPGGGVNPFAEVLREERLAAVGASQSGFGSFETSKGPPAFTGFDATSSFGGSTVAASWYENPRGPMGPPPTNGQATAGLVLSLLGFSIVGIVLSVIGLKRATENAGMGNLPVGRTRARWGLGLGIASIVLTIASTVLYVLVFSSMYNSYLLDPYAYDTSPGITETDNSLAVPVPLLYDREAVESELTDLAAAQLEAAPEFVGCPDISTVVDSSPISCDLVVNGQNYGATITYTDEIGSHTILIEHAVQ